uniref:Uncharacterized protein n=1 Tax=Salix viminalis TaxID=40686 RepID=A0A6N2MQ35_SALVM
MISRSPSFIGNHSLSKPILAPKPSTQSHYAFSR